MKTLLERISSLRDNNPDAGGGGPSPAASATPAAVPTPGAPASSAAPNEGNIYDRHNSSNAPAGDPAGGDAPDFSGGGDDPANNEPANNDPTDPNVPAAAGAPTAQPAPQPQVLKLDPETLAALRAQAPAAAPAAPQGPDPRELRALLNPVEVTPELLQGMGFTEATPEQVQGFQTFANATVKNAVSVARVLLERKEKEFMTMIEPMMRVHHQQQREAAQGRFYKSFPHLEKFKNIVKVAAAQIQTQHADGREKTEAELFQDVAGATISTLTSAGINVATVPNANPGAGPINPVPKPNKMSGPGRSNGSVPPSNQTLSPDAKMYKRHSS